MKAKYPRTASFSKTPLEDPITEFVSPLIFQHKDTTKSLGTATIITSYLAITARHVIEEHLRETGSPDTGIDNDAEFNLFLYQNLQNATPAWTVTQIYLAPNTDIAVLKLSPGNQEATIIQPRRPILQLYPPALNSRISAFGYPDTTVSSPDGLERVLDINGHTTTGKIIAVHKNMRDSSMLPFPCAQVNAQFEGGMSGGPVFNDRGQIVGVISTEFETESKKEHLSYIALLWPMMSTMISLDRVDHPEMNGKKYRFLELARENHIAASNWERVSFFENEGGHFTKFQFDHGSIKHLS